MKSVTKKVSQVKPNDWIVLDDRTNHRVTGILFNNADRSYRIWYELSDNEEYIHYSSDTNVVVIERK